MDKYIAKQYLLSVQYSLQTGIYIYIYIYIRWTERVAAQAVIISIFIFTYLALLSNKLNSAKTKLAHILFNQVRMRIFSA